MSQILLGVVSADKKDRGLTRHENMIRIIIIIIMIIMIIIIMIIIYWLTRHEKRFGITSFIYRARYLVFSRRIRYNVHW